MLPADWLSQFLLGVQFRFGYERDSSDGSSISMVLRGKNHEVLQEYAYEAARRLFSIPSVTEISTGIEAGNKEIEVHLNRVLMEKYGLNAAAIVGAAGKAIARK